MAIFTCEAMEGRVFLAAGALVTSFGVGGYAVPTAPEVRDAYPVALTAEADGHLLLLAQPDDSFGKSMELVRYSSAGQVDTSFGVGGIVGTFAMQTPRALATMPDGKIVVAGGDAQGKLVMVRLNANGSLDSTFGQSGVVQRADSAAPTQVIVEGDGDVIAAAPASSMMTVERYLASGQPDTTFGTSGRVIWSVTGVPRKLALLADGDILLAGSVAISGKQEFMLARFNGDGSHDTAFGTMGMKIGRAHV
jgi:serralysin